MPTTIHELARSRPHSVDPKNPSLEIKLIAFWEEDDAVIRDEVANYIETNGIATYAGLALLAVQPDPQGGGVWYVNLRYGIPEGIALPAVGTSPPPPGVPPPPPPPTPGQNDALGNEWSATTTGGTKKVYQSLETRNSVKLGGGTPPDYKRAIGVSKDGVEGVEVIAPKLEITYTTRRAAITLDYLLTLHELTGTINFDPFFYFPRGSVLFLGADCSFRQNEGFAVVYKFSVASGGDIEVAPDMVLEDCHGWDHIWVQYEEGTSEGYTVKTPIAAYCEQVYLMTDFEQLEIGGMTE